MKYGLNLSQKVRWISSRSARSCTVSILASCLSAKRPRARSMSAAESSTWPPTWPTAFGLQHRHRHRDGGLPHRRSDRRAGARDGRRALLQALQARRRARARTWQPSTATAARACVRRWSSTTARTRPPPGSNPVTSTGQNLRGAACAGSTAAASSRPSRETTGEVIIEAMQAAKAAGAVTSFDLNYRAKLWNICGRPGTRAAGARPHRRERRCPDRQRGRPADGPGHSGPGGGRQIQARSQRVLQHDRQGPAKHPHVKIVATTLREVHSTNRHGWGAVAWIDGQTYVSPHLRARRARSHRRRRRLCRGSVLRPADRRAGAGSRNLGWAHGALLTTFPGDMTMATLEQVGLCQRRLGTGSEVGSRNEERGTRD